jgi:cell wall-associated NlpC family hydrolase
MIDDLLGVPYKKNGKLPEGLDCYTLVQEICRRQGFKLPEFASPEEDNLIDLIISEQLENYVEKIEEPEPYCFVLFTPASRFVTHIGIVDADTRYFIHITKKKSVVKERLDHRYWVQKIKGLYRWKKQ